MKTFDPIYDYLSKRGPSLSSEVAEHLIGTLGISPSAARKRVSRGGQNVRRLAGLTFPRGARFIYLESQFGSPLYWGRLAEALIATRSAHGYAIAALRERNGIIPSAHFTIACGAPVRQAKHLSADTVFQRLSEAGLLEKKHVPGLGECICLIQHDGFYDHWRGVVHARLLTEQLLLTAIKDWVRKLGIGSYGRVALRDEDGLPKVGTFAWDLTAPSYLGAMVRSVRDGKPKPGFFVCDVFLGDDALSAQGAAPFIRKCLTLRQLRNIGPCMQLFVARKFSAGAHRLLKENGIIAATPDSLFGREVAEGLAQLTSLIQRADFMSVDPVEFDTLFKSFSRVEGAAIQLRGTLFEFLVADVVRKVVPAHVRLNRTYRGAKGEIAEVDVVAIRDGKSVTFIECKGYGAYAILPDEQVKHWLQHTVPTVYYAARNHPDWKNLELNFELWSTGQLSDEAIAMVAEAARIIRPTRYSVKLRDQDEVASCFKEANDESIAVAYRKHFAKRGKQASVAEIETSDDEPIALGPLTTE